MSPRTLRTLIASVGTIASVTLVIAFIAVLPRSAHPGAKVVVGGAASTPLSALDVRGRASQSPGSTTSTAAGQSRPTVAAPSGATGATANHQSAPNRSTTSVAGAPVTGPTTAPTTPPGSVPTTATTVAPVALAASATGRLAVAVAVRTSGSVGPGGGIATMAADGSGRRLLVTGNDSGPQWTPDGRFIVFSDNDSSTTEAIPAGGGKSTELSDAYGVSISPDGTQLVEDIPAPFSIFSAPALAVQPMTETASGLAAGPPTPLGVNGTNPIWSPDGSQILYATEQGGTTGLAIVNADGTGNRDLLASAPVQAEGLYGMGFSPDGSTIAFVGTNGIAYLIGSDGQDLRPALPASVPGISAQNAFGIAWAPHEQRLAVLVNGATSVVVVDTTGDVVAADHLAVTSLPGSGISFDRSGNYLYYLGGVPPDFSDLYSIAVSGGVSHLVGTGDPVSDPPAVLP